MKTVLFSNNSASTLRVGIGASDTKIALQIGDFWKFNGQISSNKGAAQPLTLLDPVTGVMEVVYGVDRDWWGTPPDPDAITVLRAQEGTAARAWPAGTVVEARLTAGMMGRMCQNAAAGYGALSISRDIFYPNAFNYGSVGIDASVYASRGWVIKGVPHIGRDDWNYGSGFDWYNGPDTTCTTPFVDLGSGVPWQANATYLDGAVVVPTTPNGMQYHLWRDAYDMAASATSVTVDATEPEWPAADGDSVTAAESPVYADWICVDVATNGFSIDIPSDFVFYPAEIGFICFNYSNVTAPPSISVGTTEDATLFLNNQALGQIDGPRQRQGFTGFKHGVSTAMKFKASTPAAGTNSQFHGRFYIKGTFVQKQG